MAFWSNASSEAKRNYRFKVFLGDGADSVVWWAKGVTLPSFDVTETEHDYLDNKYYFPGRVTWSEVELTMVDPISTDAVDKTNQILVSSGYKIAATQATQKSFITKAASDTAVNNFEIQVLNGEGTVIEKWILKNVFIKAAKFGDLAYDNDDLREITMTLRYDWAECTIGSGTPTFAPA